MTNILSIIIPVYNVAEYLTQCLDSVYSQIRDNYEVILVDDGSTDDSGLICEEYNLKYPQTIVVHKENGGLSDARNAGIKVASGQYIYFIDSDDWLAPNAISTLLDYAIENKCEVVQGGLYYAYNDYLLYDNSKTIPFILNREQAMKELIKNDYIKNFAWGKIYKTEIVKKHLFIKGVYFEDSYWQHYIIHNVNNYGVIPTPLYYYRQRESSISGEFSAKSLDLLKGYEQRFYFIKDLYPKLMPLMTKQYWNLLSQMLLASKYNAKCEQQFKNYRTYAIKKHKSIFDKHLKFSFRYRICQKNSSLLKIFSLYDRIIAKLTKNKFIKTNTSNSI